MAVTDIVNQYNKNSEINNASQEDKIKYEINYLTAKNNDLELKEHIYRLALSVKDDVFIYEDVANHLFFVSDYFYSFFSMEAQNKFSKNEFLNVISEEDRPFICQCLLDKEKTKQNKSYTFRIAGEDKWIKSTIKHQYDKDEILIERIFYFQNITEEKQQQDNLSYMAYHDTLTGFYNRNYFVQKLQEIMGNVYINNQSLAIIYVDIDNFQVINDSLGFVTGDELVRSFAQNIKSLLGDGMFAARISNDEFCIAIHNPVGASSTEQFYYQLKETVEIPYNLQDGSEVHFTISAGVAEYPEGGENPLELIKNSEIAMYEVKKKGKNNIGYFDAITFDHFMEDVIMEKELKRAIQNDNFILYYQPQFDAFTKKLRGVEALLRWKKEDGTFVPPDKFIPIAERNGTIVTIGDWVMEEAIKTIAHWQKTRQFDGIMSINISTIQIRRDDFVRNLKALIEKYHVNPENIEIEITESVLIDDLPRVVAKINKIRAYGVKVSLDDFGTGYSSLSYLRDLPIDTLKIDKSFIDTVITERSTDIITQSVISMVKELGVETVAEGVETVEQLEYLKNIKCDNIQGFLLGKPMQDIDIECILAAS